MPAKKQSNRYAIGIDLGGTNLRAGIVNTKGKLLSSLKISTPKSNGKNRLLHLISLAIKESQQIAKKKKWKIEGIGFGCPGPLSIKKGIVYHAPNLPGWRNVPVKKFFETKFNLPVRIENDANAFALAETWIGAGKGVESCVCLTLGTGIGGGITFNGHVWHGANEVGGEIGHIVIEENGRKCNCGNSGCFEAYASATAIIKRTHQLLKQKKTKSLLRKQKQLTCKAIYDAAKKGDALAKKVTQEISGHLGAGLTSLVHLLNPDRIVIGGGVALNGPFLFNPLRKNVRKQCFPQATQNLKILPAKLGDHAGMIGAAKAFFDQI